MEGWSALRLGQGRSAAAATAVVATAAIAAAAAAVAAATTAAAAATAEQDDNQNDDPQAIAAPTIITTHKIASSKVRMFGSTRKHRASFHPMPPPQKSAGQKRETSNGITLDVSALCHFSSVGLEIR